MVLTPVLRRLILGSVVVFFASCTPYRMFEVEVLRPARVLLEPGKEVALLDRGLRRNDSLIIFKDEGLELEFVKEFMRGMNYVLVDMGYDTVVVLGEGDRRKIEKDVTPGYLFPDFVVSWCQKFETDYIISLEVIGYELLQGKVNCSLRAGLYRSGEALPLDIFNLQSALPEKLSYYKEWNHEWLIEDITTAYWKAGASYARRIVPHWEKTERRMYVRGRALGMGYAFWQSDRKQEAMRIWEGLTRLSDKKAIKACINLAWAYEDAGDFDSALACLQQAENVIGQKNRRGMLPDYLHNYLKKIKERIKQRDMLDVQLNSFE